MSFRAVFTAAEAMDKSCKQGRLKVENLKAQLKLFQNDPSVGHKLNCIYCETTLVSFLSRTVQGQMLGILSCATGQEDSNLGVVYREENFVYILTKHT